MDVNPHHIILTAAISIAATVISLEYYGYLNHSREIDRLTPGHYRAIILEGNESFKMSPKDADTKAVCHQGYLTLNFSHNNKPAGILVDDKNRGIKCQ